jgi:Flp pilus assembly protein TadD
MAAYYLKAAALARLNDYDGARAALLEAARREPHDFVPWQLLGDLDMRKYAATADPRYPRLAKADYGRARDLNPRDPEIATLAKYPSLGLPKNR